MRGNGNKDFFTYGLIAFCIRLALTLTLIFHKSLYVVRKKDIRIMSICAQSDGVLLATLGLKTIVYTLLGAGHGILSLEERNWSWFNLDDSKYDREAVCMKLKSFREVSIEHGNQPIFPTEFGKLHIFRWISVKGYFVGHGNFVFWRTEYVKVPNLLTLILLKRPSKKCVTPDGEGVTDLVMHRYVYS